jgi:hypothetical protein
MNSGLSYSSTPWQDRGPVLAQSPTTTTPGYYRHQPEQTELHSVIAKHYPRFVDEIGRSGGYLPKFVRQEFEDYLKCGLLEHGFLRVRCDSSSLDHLQAASINYRIAIGPHAGRKALSLFSVPPLEKTSNNPLLARASGFSLHAATVCETWQRSRLERLCRYITRPPIATKRLSVDDRGRRILGQGCRSGGTYFQRRI